MKRHRHVTTDRIREGGASSGTERPSPFDVLRTTSLRAGELPLYDAPFAPAPGETSDGQPLQRSAQQEAGLRAWSAEVVASGGLPWWSTGLFNTHITRQGGAVESIVSAGINAEQDLWLWEGGGWSSDAASMLASSPWVGTTDWLAGDDARSGSHGERSTMGSLAGHVAGTHLEGQPVTVALSRNPELQLLTLIYESQRPTTLTEQSRGKLNTALQQYRTALYEDLALLQTPEVTREQVDRVRGSLKDFHQLVGSSIADTEARE